MTSWSEGYVSDIAYSIGYYREMTPDHVGYAALSLGKHPGGALRPKRVLELGFGMGLGFVLGAAANPQTEFEGCDFNPEHIMHARALAEGAGLTNVTIREASFQELAAEAREGQHDLDIIQLHGILTWVSDDAHRAIVEIARKRLKPGGLLYVSYNCMPGWAPMLPVQRLMREHAKRHSGSSLQRTAGAVQAVKQLIDGKGRFFAANPAIEQRIEKLGTMQASYLAHEYLNENWFIFHVADVAEMFGQAKLTFLGSATIAENIDGVSVPAEMREMVAQAADPIWKETLRDIAGNKQFRRDLYARGVTNLNNHETLRQLHATRYTLAMPRSAITFKLPSLMGELDAKPEIYGAIADLLADEIVPFDAILTLPALAEVGLGGTLQALALMVHAGQVLPILGEPETDLEPARRFNRMLAGLAAQGRIHNFVAAPLARAGLPATSTEMLMLGAVLDGKENDPPQIALHVHEMLRRLGISLNKDGKPVTDPVELQQMLAQEVKSFLDGKLPLWKRLGVV